MKSINYEHAAQRKTLVGYVYSKGSEQLKEEILEELDKEHSALHREGYIHIHDLEAYGESYNCLTPDILKGFPYEELKNFSDSRKVMEIFRVLKEIIVGLGNEQSGGIGFGNFDFDMDEILNDLDLHLDEISSKFFKDNIDLFLKFINNSRDRCGQVQYYVTLNLGLSTGDTGRFITSTILDCFMNSKYIRPNIIFKVKSGVNKYPNDRNFDLFQKAMECTAKKMIPTYFLCDSEHNMKIDSYKISLMGCRSKVYQDEYGDDTTIGKSNVVYNSINLPRIALDINKEFPNRTIEEKIVIYKRRWLRIAEGTKDLLFDRFYKICNLDTDDFPTNQKYNLLYEDLKGLVDLEDEFKHGTLAIGFIGLSEAIELLTGEKYFSSHENHKIALDLIKMMRETIDEYRAKYNYNFSLLATSGEYISGRFPKIDKKFHSHPLIDKGFYTNSFHVDVDSGLNPFEKLSYEGPFHKYCNGGCISYLEFTSAPLNNIEAINELIEHSIKCNINYLGFNFPLDICLDCGARGTFDNCDNCGSEKIQRIRRVSGYLEDAEFFTDGKKAELVKRKPNLKV